jgi:hypothetical protein
MFPGNWETWSSEEDEMGSISSQSFKYKGPRGSILPLILKS